MIHSKRYQFRILLVRTSVLVATVVSVLISASSGVGATFTVDRTDDDPSAFFCTAGPFDCSVRGSVIASNISPGADTIVIPAATYELEVSGSDEDDAATGDLDITDSVTIQGAGSDSTTIAWVGMQSDRDRVLHILAADADLRDLRVEGGSNVDQGAGILVQGNGSTSVSLTDIRINLNDSQQQGGGIHCDSADLEVSSSVISNNRAISFGDGNALFASSCAVTIDGSEFRDNSALGGGVAGGTLQFQSPTGVDLLTVTDTVFRDNFATQNGGAITILEGSGTVANSIIEGNSAFNNGGGIFVGEEAALTLTGSTVGNNTAQNGFGGGIQVEGSFTLVDSTVRCNEAEAASGGLGLSDGSVANITNSTISQNSSDVGAGINAVLADLTLTNTTIAGQFGDGLAMVTTFGTVNVTNTVFGDTCAQQPSSTIISGGGNVEPLGQTCVDAPLASDQSVADLRLGPLGDFGGPTRTHLPLPLSPVIGRAIGASCPPADQRGLPRIDCDSGSVELQVGDPEPIFMDDTECMGLELWTSTSP